MIEILSPETIRHIAAGETIARPTDALRELLENALDAGASRIEIEWKKGGFDSLSVSDNGAGIAATDLPRAPLRHATSKLPANAGEHGDWQGKISALGFRGEALWAMAQAATLEMVSRPLEQVGAARVAAHLNEISVERCAGRAGTIVRLFGMFSHLPARLAAQASPVQEARELLALVGRYALHHPAVHWQASEDGAVIFSHAASDTVAALAVVHGPLVANRMLNIERQKLPFAGKEALLSGACSRPELRRGRRDRLYFAVNGRPTALGPELEQAIFSAYGELLPKNSAPVVVLNLDLPPELVNPNVHPQKQTVAFSYLPELTAALQAAIASRLQQEHLAPAAPQLREDGPTPTEVPHEGFPSLRFLQVYRELYILAEAEGDLWIVDGHAAHERMLYEKLLREAQHGPPFLLQHPELLNVSAATYAKATAKQNELQAWGLRLQPFGGNVLRLSALPQALAAVPPRVLWAHLQDTFEEHDLNEALRNAFGRLACLPALKAGHIDEKNGKMILQGLSRCEQPWTCPHGRPTALRLSERDLAQRFGRRNRRNLPLGRDEEN